MSLDPIKTTTVVWDAAGHMTRTPDTLEHLATVATQMATNIVKEHPLWTFATVGITSIGGSYYVAKHAIRAYRAGNSESAKRLGFIAAGMFAAGAVSLGYAGVSMYSNVTTPVSTKRFFETNDSHFFYAGTQDYNKYGEPVGLKQYQHTGDCYQRDRDGIPNFETVAMCHYDAVNEYKLP